MPNIIWEGNQDWDKKFIDKPLTENAKKISRPDDIVKASTPYMILPGVLCFIAVLVKSRIAGEFIFNLWFAPLAFAIGFIVAMPLHELLHAICYPRGATVYIGVCLKQLKAYAVSFYPITRTRFVGMSLVPMLPGLIALMVFLLCPITWKPVMTVCVVSAFMGLISPAPDYMDIAAVCRQAPRNAKIQASNEGLFYFT